MINIDRSIVASIEVPNRNYRLDPSQYNQKGEKMIRHLKYLGYPLKKICELDEFNEIYLPNRFSRIYLEDDNSYGLPMLGTSTMLMLKLPQDSRIKISEDINKSPLRIQAGDILVSRSGTVGTTVLCGETYIGYVASDDCFRLRLSKNIQGFITAYLKSPFGKTLLIRDKHGKVIHHLKNDNITNLNIPIIDTNKLEEINNIMLNSVSLIDLARKSLAQAENEIDDIILNSSSNSKSYARSLNPKNKSFIKDFRSVFKSRLDAHFYDPDIDYLRNQIVKLPHRKIGEIADVWVVSRFKRHRANKGHGVPLYSSADIIRAILKPSSYLSVTRNSKNIKECQIEEGTILIPCSGTFGGIMGRCVRAVKRLHGQAVTQHVLRIKVTDPDFNPDYVAALLGSMKYGYPLITAFRYGKDVPELPPEDLKSIPIPFLSPEQQKKIAKYVRSAFESLECANELEDQAQIELLEALQWTEGDENLSENQELDELDKHIHVDEDNDLD